MKKLIASLSLALLLGGCATQPYYGYGQDNYIYMGGYYGYYGANHTFIHVQQMSPYQYQQMRQRQIMARQQYIQQQRTYQYQQRLNSIRSVTVSRGFTSSSGYGSSYRSSGSFGGGGFRSGRR